MLGLRRRTVSTNVTSNTSCLGHVSEQELRLILPGAYNSFMVDIHALGLLTGDRRWQGHKGRMVSDHQCLPASHEDVALPLEG